MQIFAKVKYFCKRLRIAMTLGCNFWDMIAIIITLNILYNKFNSIIASLLETTNKIID